MGPLMLPALFFGGLAAALVAERVTTPPLQGPAAAPQDHDTAKALSIVDLGVFPLAVVDKPVYGHNTRTAMVPHRARRASTFVPPAPTMDKPVSNAKKHSLSNLLSQPLEVAVDAARHRFMRSSAVANVRQGEGQILVELDPDSTSTVLIPPSYLGWPIQMVDASP